MWPSRQASIPWFVKIAPSSLIRHVAKKRARNFLRLPDEVDNDTLVHISTSKKHLKASVKMNKAYGSTVDYMRAIKNPTEIKTVVITRGKRFPYPPWTTPEREQDWREGHKTLLTGVKNGRHLIASESDHAVNFDQPDLIVETVFNLIEDSRD